MIQVEMIKSNSKIMIRKVSWYNLIKILMAIVFLIIKKMIDKNQEQSFLKIIIILE